MKYIFDKKAIEDMKNMTIRSKKIDLELGGLLCSNKKNKKVTLQKKCSGDSCEVVVKGSCGSLNNRIGIFHTHPKSSTLNLSFKDINNYESNEDELGCLGLGKKSSVVCFTHKEPEERIKRQNSRVELYNSMNDAVKSNKKSDLKKVEKNVKFYQENFFEEFEPVDK